MIRYLKIFPITILLLIFMSYSVYAAVIQSAASSIYISNITSNSYSVPWSVSTTANQRADYIKAAAQISKDDIILFSDYNTNSQSTQTTVNGKQSGIRSVKAQWGIMGTHVVDDDYEWTFDYVSWDPSGANFNFND